MLPAFLRLTAAGSCVENRVMMIANKIRAARIQQYVRAHVVHVYSAPGSNDGLALRAATWPVSSADDRQIRSATTAVFVRYGCRKLGPTIPM